MKRNKVDYTLSDDPNIREEALAMEAEKELNGELDE